MTQEVYEFFISGIFSLSVVVGILEGNIRKRDEFPNPHRIVGLRNDLLKISVVFLVDFPLKILVDALNQKDHLLVDQPQHACRCLMNAFDEFWGWDYGLSESVSDNDLTGVRIYGEL